MDVSTGNLGTNGYRSNAYGGGRSIGSSGGDDHDRYATTSSRSLKFGDSLLVGAPLARKVTPKTQVDPKQTLKWLELGRTICYSLAAVATFVFGIMALQPILLPLFTFGMCFSGGFAEWMEFSGAVLKISLVPAVIALGCGWTGYFVQRKAKALANQLKQQEERPGPQFSPALMARLNQAS